MSSTSSSVLTLSSFNLLFFTQVLTVLSSTIKYNEYATDKGGNVSIPCIAQGNIMWVKEHGNNSTIFQTGRVLVLRNVSTSDAGIYVCFASVPRPSTTTTTTTTRATTTTSATTSNLATSATTSSPNQQQQESEKQDEDDVEVRESPRDSQQESETEEEEVEVEYQAQQRTRLIVRTVPGPVSQLYFKASTILGFLIWRFNKTQSGGYPVRSFTAEYRNVSYKTPPANASFEHAWSRMDPINIAFNVRQMEVYRLAPNTTYEFRIWANNELGSGEVVTTNVTTLPETKEEASRTADQVVMVKVRRVVLVPVAMARMRMRRTWPCPFHAPSSSGSTIERRRRRACICRRNSTTCIRLATTRTRATTTSTTISSTIGGRTRTMTMTTRRSTNPPWSDSSAKFPSSSPAPPSSEFEAYSSYLMRVQTLVTTGRLGCCIPCIALV
ncbi:contactin-2 isoform X2 [Drosophila ficusphila]|uniref:contactin-2 isoform X2 n=1 Tax=Drosophila ficusphila TaxID=30025 RepID=UPI0007E62FFA|nr:contactin-2 isoform X2 [Drosophila ficusphila]